MLIVDLYTYIRQLLPPDRRDQSFIGMIAVLFRPIMQLIDTYNDYRYYAWFDTGSGGQVFVLQHILRERVHPAIRIVDGNFSDIDFRILVPPALTNDENALLIGLVERFRLHSRRYDVSVQANWGPGGAVGGLQWIEGYPRLTEVVGGWVIQYGIRQTGLYLTRIKNERTGATPTNHQVAYMGGSVFSMFVADPGVYTIRIGGLQATLMADNTGVICDLSYAYPPVVEVIDDVARLSISLYSGRANIGPFVTRLYNQEDGLLGEVSHAAHSGQVVIPRYPDGTYRVETLDRFGCKTSREDIVIGVPLAWNPGFPRIGEGNRILYSVNHAGILPVFIQRVGGSVFIDQSIVLDAWIEYTTDPVPATGVYFVSVGGLEAYLTIGAAVSCDLTWADMANPSAPLALDFRISGDEQQVKPALYSSRANLHPFFLELLQGGTVAATATFSAHNTWISIPSIPAGVYQVRVTDKDGCRTTTRELTVTEAGGSPLAITNTAANISSGLYSLTVAFTGGTGNKTIQVVGTGGLITSVSGVSVSPRTITLPAGTPPQTVKVVVQDVTGSVEQNGVVLSPASTGAYAPVLWSEGNKKYIDIRVTGTPGNWLISDASGYQPPSGFQHYYYIGNKKIRQFGPLVNEPWQTNQPVHVMLCFIKPAVADINVWTYALRYPGGWGDPNAGLMLDKADIGVFETYIFKKQ